MQNGREPIAHISRALISPATIMGLAGRRLPTDRVFILAPWQRRWGIFHCQSRRMPLSCFSLKVSTSPPLFNRQPLGSPIFFFRECAPNAFGTLKHVGITRERRWFSGEPCSAIRCHQYRSIAPHCM
ncbi:hypothetical protein B0H12DRAFT_565024 [Mycena haematopus]|nr:hypothetical protein B0H12DRAFT_565024 [Mycena haematopus]